MTPSLALDHGRQILDGLRALDLRDQQTVAAGLAQQAAGLVHVRGVARKGDAEVVHLEARRRDDVLAILVGQARRRTGRRPGG